MIYQYAIYNSICKDTALNIPYGMRNIQHTIRIAEYSAYHVIHFGMRYIQRMLYKNAIQKYMLYQNAIYSIYFSSLLEYCLSLHSCAPLSTDNIYYRGMRCIVHKELFALNFRNYSTIWSIYCLCLFEQLFLVKITYFTYRIQ